MHSKSDTTVVWGIRHGQTNSNATGVRQGHIDTILDAVGRTQAKALQPVVERLDWEIVISSDLERAAETARLALSDRSDALVLEPYLRERNMGVLEGLTDAQAKLEQPDAWAVFRREEAWNTPLEGGESLAEFHARCMSALSMLAETYRGRRVLVFTHGGVLRQWFRQAVGLAPNAPRRFSSINASLCALHHDEARGWHLQTWGQIDHLDAFLT